MGILAGVAHLHTPPISSELVLQHALFAVITAVQLRQGQRLGTPSSSDGLNGRHETFTQHPDRCGIKRKQQGLTLVVPGCCCSSPPSPAAVPPRVLPLQLYLPHHRIQQPGSNSPEAAPAADSPGSSILQPTSSDCSLEWGGLSGAYQGQSLELKQRPGGGIRLPAVRS